MDRHAREVLQGVYYQVLEQLVMLYTTSYHAAPQQKKTYLNLSNNGVSY